MESGVFLLGDMTREERQRQRASRLKRGALAAIFLVGGICLLNRFIPSKKHMDPGAFFKVSDGECAVVADGILCEEKGFYLDGEYYLNCLTVSGSVNPSVFYEDTEDLVIVTTPTEKLTYPAADSPDALPEACHADGNTYVSLSLLQRVSDVSVSKYTDPFRVVIGTRDSYPVMSFQTDGPIRFRAGIRSPIIRDMEAGASVRVLDVTEDGEPSGEKIDGWTRVFTEDGYTGYAEDRFLGELKREETGIKGSSSRYTRSFLDGKVKMIFHQTTDEASNRALAESLGDFAGLNVIGPTWFFLESTDGGVASLASRSYVETAHIRGMKVWALVNDFDGSIHSASETGEALSSDSSRSRIVREVMEGADESGADGICLDIELVRRESAADYLELIREFSAECRKRGMTLSVCNYVPAFTSYLGRSEQARVADYLIVMCYDEHTAGSDKAGSVSSLPFVEKGIADTIREADADQVIAALPFYTRLWTTAPDGALSSSSCGMTRAEAYVEELRMETSYDAAAAQNYAEKREENGTLSQIWLEDTESLKAKLQAVREAGCAGTAFWKLGLENSGARELVAGGDAQLQSSPVRKDDIERGKEY